MKSLQLENALQEQSYVSLLAFLGRCRRDQSKGCTFRYKVRQPQLSCFEQLTVMRLHSSVLMLYKTPQLNSPDLKLFLARQARATKGVTVAAAPKLQVPIQVQSVLWGSPQCQAVWAAKLEEVIASQRHASLVPGPHLSFWLHSATYVSACLMKGRNFHQIPGVLQGLPPVPGCLAGQTEYIASQRHASLMLWPHVSFWLHSEMTCQQLVVECQECEACQ